jgi:hypothetical protein
MPGCDGTRPNEVEGWEEGSAGGGIKVAGLLAGVDVLAGPPEILGILIIGPEPGASRISWKTELAFGFSPLGTEAAPATVDEEDEEEVAEEGAEFGVLDAAAVGADADA